MTYVDKDKQRQYQKAYRERHGETLRAYKREHEQRRRAVKRGGLKALGQTIREQDVRRIWPEVLEFLLTRPDLLQMILDEKRKEEKWSR